MPRKPDPHVALPEFTDEENDWCVAVLAYPKMKPSRAAPLFLMQFDRFLEIPVDNEEHPDIEGEYYSQALVMKSVVYEFNKFRGCDTTQNYKRIQVKKDLYYQAFYGFIEVLPVFDVFEYSLVLQEMSYGIKEIDKKVISLFNEAMKLAGMFYQPKSPQNPQQEASEDPETSAARWQTERAPTRDEWQKARDEREAKLSNSQ